MASTEDRVKRIMAAMRFMPTYEQLIALTVALAQAGEPQRIEQIAAEIESVNEARARLRQQCAELGDELERELAQVSGAPVPLGG